MGRKTKLASLKVEEGVVERIKLCKSRNELEEDTIQEFVTKTLEEKLDDILYKKLLRRIEKEGLESLHTRVVRLEKMEDGIRALTEELGKDLEKRKLISSRKAKNKK